MTMFLKSPKGVTLQHETLTVATSSGFSQKFKRNAKSGNTVVVHIGLNKNNNKLASEYVRLAVII